jgi:hypothetical protein
MAKFIFSYRIPEDYAGSADSMAAWMAWFEELGDRVVDRGAPVFERAVQGGRAAGSVLGGYSLVTADDLEAATVLAKGCPALPGGTVEVGLLTEM